MHSDTHCTQCNNGTVECYVNNCDLELLPGIDCSLGSYRCHGLSLSGSTLQLPHYWPINRSHRSRNML